MRTKIVASATAAGVLLMNVAAATSQRSPAQSSENARAVPVVVADIAASAKRPLMADIAASAKRPLITAA